MGGAPHRVGQFAQGYGALPIGRELREQREQMLDLDGHDLCTLPIEAGAVLTVLVIRSCLAARIAISCALDLEVPIPAASLARARPPHPRLAGSDPIAEDRVSPSRPKVRVWTLGSDE